jgi:mono/diheme cytochrome c family protein
MPFAIALALLIGTLFLLSWLGRQASEIKSTFLRWSAVGLTAALGVVVLLITAVGFVGLFKQQSRRAPLAQIDVASTPERIQRGKAIADSFCGGCHSQTGTLTGGPDIGKDLPLPVGSFIASNLTPAGRLKNWTDAEIFRAIRNGIDAEGRWLIIMSYTNVGKLSDEDTKAVISYIRSQPASGQPTIDPPDQLTFLGFAMLGAGMLPGGKPVNPAVVSAPEKGPTIEYGEYILSYQDCRECHGGNLRGGVEGQLPPVGPDLSIVKEWSLNQFMTTLRTGVDPSGHELSKQMPWRLVGKMDDVELTAVYTYLTQLTGPQNTAARSAQ